MSKYVVFRDGGKTDEKAFYHFLSNLLSGAAIGNSFAVSQHGAGPNMSVDVAIGDALIATGSLYAYQVYTDAVENPTITTANGSNPRNDIVVAYVDITVVQSTTPDNPNALLFAVIAGTPSGSPADPSDATIQAAVGASNPFIKLARVRVGAAVSSITNANITDLRSIVTGNFNVGGSDGWITTNENWTYVQNNGQKEFIVTVSGDKSAKYQPGTKVKIPRSITPPTQCSDLESSTSQYASKTTPVGIVFTDDFTVEGWLKVESYTGSNEVILSRFDGTSGWWLFLDSNGRLGLVGFNAGGGNFKEVLSYQAVPTGTWVHVAATLDMSGSAGTTYINGALIPSSIIQGGTNPTALIQAGNLQLGAENGATNFYDGKVQDVRLWNVARTATQIRENMNQQLIGTETNLIGYWKLNGTFVDSTSNVNTMTGQNSAVATAVDSAMNATEYGKVTSVSYSSGTGLTTMSIFTGGVSNLPATTFGATSYSLQAAPFGFPAQSSAWRVSSIFTQDLVTSSPTANVWVNPSTQISVPTGAFKCGYEAILSVSLSTAGTIDGSATLSTANNTASNPKTSARVGGGSNATSSGQLVSGTIKREDDFTMAALTTLFLNYATLIGTNNLNFQGTVGYTEIYAQCEY